MLRRSAGIAAALVLGLLAACSSGGSAGPGASTAPSGSASASAGEWTYTTGYGTTVTLPQAPKVIVTDAYSAAALWDYGIRPAGVFGYGLEEGASPLALGDADRASMEVVGTGGELSIEKLAALKPDLVIGFGNEKGDGWTWWDEAVAAKATAVAPFAGVKISGQGVADVVEEYRGLARALGGDADSTTVQEAKTAFDTASTTLQTATAAKKLDAIALNGDASTLYAGGPGLAQLGLLDKLGVKIVGPKTKASADGEDWAELSWELVPDYPADLMLAYAGSTKAFADVAVYKSLPSVKADQVTVWDDKMPFTYKQYASWLGDVNTVYAAAKKVAS